VLVVSSHTPIKSAIFNGIEPIVTCTTKSDCAFSSARAERGSNVNKNKRNAGCIGKSLAKLRRIVRAHPILPALLEKMVNPSFMTQQLPPHARIPSPLGRKKKRADCGNEISAYMDTGASVCIHSRSISSSSSCRRSYPPSSRFLRSRVFALQGGHSSSHSFSPSLSTESRRNISDIARTSASKSKRYPSFFNAQSRIHISYLCKILQDFSFSFDKRYTESFIRWLSQTLRCCSLTNVEAENLVELNLGEMQTDNKTLFVFKWTLSQRLLIKGTVIK